MQKYKLIYELNDIEKEIPIMYKDNSYETQVEICYIDKITTAFNNEMEFIEALKSRNIISNIGGTLHIRRPNGKVDSLGIIYNDSKFRSVSCKAIEQSYRYDNCRLLDISEVKGCIGLTIRFFMDDEMAMKVLNETFYYKKDIKELVDNLNEYLKFKNQTSFEVHEVSRREKYKNKIYSQLKNYNLLREIRQWIYDYKCGKKKLHYTTSTWKNPYEEYEKRLDENNSCDKYL